MVNSCNFVGRMVADPKSFGGDVNRVCFTLAVDRDNYKDGKSESDYLNFVAWKETADYVMRHLYKGDLVAVVNARAKVHRFDDGESRVKKSTEFEVNKVYCLQHARDRKSAE